jgi:hypothetical protein
MTPEGVYGSRNALDSLEEFYGGFLPCIRAIETASLPTRTCWGASPICTHSPT